MGDFGEAERRILGFMSEGTEFVFEGKEYECMEIMQNVRYSMLYYFNFYEW